MANTNVKCKIFYCSKIKKYMCCEYCERKDDCQTRCRNNPKKCGYASSNVFSDAVICPFFSWSTGRTLEERKRIVCEGMVDNTSNAMYFRNETDKINHMKTFCCDDYSKCEYAKCVNAKYYKEKTNGCYNKLKENGVEVKG